MAKLTTAQAIKRFRAAKSMAHEILNAESSGLPNREEVLHLATAIFGADLASGGKLSSVDRAGADEDQDSMLREAYSTRQGDASGTY